MAFESQLLALAKYGRSTTLVFCFAKSQMPVLLKNALVFQLDCQRYILVFFIAVIQNVEAVSQPKPYKKNPGQDSWQSIQLTNCPTVDC